MTDFATSADGIRIAYDREGQAPFVLLLHGFASSRVQNWAATGWYRVLRAAGRGILSLDFRGHGDSDKPHDPAAFGERLTGDARTVLEQCDVPSADVFGYSMGGAVGLLLAARHPHLVRRLIVAGVGETYLRAPLPGHAIAAALEADTPPTGTGAAAAFRHFADQPGKDRFALAACARALPPRLGQAQLRSIEQPVLVMTGDGDTMAGASAPLAASLAHGYAHTLLGRDHMSAVGDLNAKRTAAAFLVDA